jgi:hypothetical protein
MDIYIYDINSEHSVVRLAFKWDCLVQMSDHGLV